MDMSVFEEIIPVQDIKQFIDKHLKTFIAGGLLFAGLVGAWYYFAVYKVQEDARAHATMTEVLQEVARAVTEPDVWQDVEVAARTGYRQHSGSTLAPYFVALEADALLQQGKTEEGITKLSQAINGLAHDAPLTDLYQLKLARLQLAQEATREQGVATLLQLAGNQKSLVHDEALYHLGVYYAQQGDTDKARETLQQVVSLYKEVQELGQSPWLPLAQEQLERIG